jgi:hypothetical protein
MPLHLLAQSLRRYILEEVQFQLIVILFRCLQPREVWLEIALPNKPPRFNFRRLFILPLITAALLL